MALRLLMRSPRMKPTAFRPHPHLPESSLYPPSSEPFRHLDPGSQNIDDRYTFVSALGSGSEGRTALYVDHRQSPPRRVAIKSFLRGVRRNSLPAHLKELFCGRQQSLWVRGSWPSEIPATLFLGWSNASFVHALDYFRVRNAWAWPDNWRLVTPFFDAGTLDKLARLLRHRGMAPDEVDRVYRRRFRAVLLALAELHREGYCHDDIKMDNIFVDPETHGFLVGDLGNVRELEHAFHLSSPHVHNNDFRRGDAECAVRTYLAFLRDASAGPGAFDRQFLERRTEWSQFYWRHRDSKTAHPISEELVVDPFWQDDGSVTDENVEKEVDGMRVELQEWKQGNGKQPRWYKEEPENAGSTVSSDDERRARVVEEELRCVKVPPLSRWIPWSG